jgi:hypothetical protein
MNTFRIAVLSSALLLDTSRLLAQPTINILQRVFMIEYDNERGTAFSIDVDGREYWITAKHILTGTKSKPYGTFGKKTVELKLLNPGGDGQQWMLRQFTVLQPTADVDVVVLVPTAKILPTDVHPSPPATSDGLTFGGSCEFLGFAYGGGWRVKLEKGAYWSPYIKRCGISGMDIDSRLWILDGINNLGFSGGPVIFGTGNDLKIVAIISGYIQEPAEVIAGAPTLVVRDRGYENSRAPKAQRHGQEIVNLNSGFILAYDIEHAVDLIKANPIGPMRKSE